MDLDFELLDPNVQKTGDLITLKYDNKSWIRQPLASRVENVNPFNMVEFRGRVVQSLHLKIVGLEQLLIDGGRVNLDAEVVVLGALREDSQEG